MLYLVLALAACTPCLIMFLFYKRAARPVPSTEDCDVDQVVRGSLPIAFVVALHLDPNRSERPSVI